MGAQSPKVLLLLDGRPLLAHVVDSVRDAGISRVIVVVGAGRDQVVRQFAGQGLEFAVQHEQKGTADAVLACSGLLGDDEVCVVVCGDMPLVTGRTVRKLITAFHERQADVAVLTAVVDNPRGYGRIMRAAGDLVDRIVEERDADDHVRSTREVNSGFYAFRWGKVQKVLQSIKPSPVSGEYYLTEMVSGIRAEHGQVVAVQMDDPKELMGANTPEQRGQVSAEFARRRADCRR